MLSYSSVLKSGQKHNVRYIDIIIVSARVEFDIGFER